MVKTIASPGAIPEPEPSEPSQVAVGDYFASTQADCLLRVSKVYRSTGGVRWVELERWHPTRRWIYFGTEYTSVLLTSSRYTRVDAKYVSEEKKL